PPGTHKLGVPGKAVAQGVGLMRVTGSPRYAKGFGVPEPWRTWRSHPYPTAKDPYPRLKRSKAAHFRYLRGFGCARPSFPCFLGYRRGKKGSCTMTTLQT